MKRFLTLMAFMMMMVTSSLADTPDYLRFYLPKALNKTMIATTQISFNIEGSLDSTPTLEYSLDGTTWNDYTFGKTLLITSSTSKEVGIYFRAKVTMHGTTVVSKTNSTFSKDYSNYIQFTSTGTICADGNIMSLLDASCEQTSVPKNAFTHLFHYCSGLKTAPSLPATELGESCYGCMFAESDLTKAPALPATTLVSDCYGNMFYGCTSLETAPSLPAVEMKSMCYRYMFQGCTALTTAPDLPATTLNTHCYVGMFMNCTSLVNAPDLPAKTLEPYCYYEMFSGCTKLNNITVGFTDWETAGKATTDWLKGVAETGTFYCPADLDISTRGASTFPAGWNKANPLYFTVEETGTNIAVSCADGMTNVPSIQVSGNGYQWFDYNMGRSMSAGLAGDTLYFRAKDKNATFSEKTTDCVLTVRFDISNGKLAAGGNIMSLLDKTCMQTSVPDYAFTTLFLNCTNLTAAPELPATTLGSCCYSGMFKGCTNLTEAPVLPATTLHSNCYEEMFYGCTKLNRVIVGFTNWYDYLYSTNNWLYGVSETGTFTCPEGLDVSTRGASTFPETWNCLKPLVFTAEAANVTVGFNKVGDWTGKTTPSLLYSTDASTWQTYEYGTNITLANAGDKAYFMADGTNTKFTQQKYVRDDESGSTDPIYVNFFANGGKVAASGSVMSLLNTETLPTHAFSGLFANCTNLTSAPELPATTLAQYCYQNMFYGCTNLMNAPVLPATDIVSFETKNAYRGMFDGCENISSVTVGFTEWPSDDNYTKRWLNGVATTGTFNCPPTLADPTERGVSTVPTGWSIPRPLCFTATDEAGLSIAFLTEGTLKNVPSLEYSTDGVTWTDYTINGSNSEQVTVSKDSKIYFRAKDKNATFSEDDYNFVYVNASSKVEVSGNIMSLLDKSCQQTSVPDYAFYNLFGALVQDYLMSAPDLPATTLGKYCYHAMFSRCTNLTQAPELPAENLAEGCYGMMFYGCTGLTNAPELPAKTLAKQCYSNMFEGCTSLNSVKVGFTDWNDSNYSTLAWLKNVASTGTFTCPADLDASKTGMTYIPEGWTASTTGTLTADVVTIAHMIDAMQNGRYSAAYDLNGDGKLTPADIESINNQILGCHDCPVVEIGGVKWATMNLGAPSAYEYGDYYAWGATYSYSLQKEPFTWSNYCGSESFTEWNPAPFDDNNTLKPEYDAAHVQWGGNWYMPTPADFKALLVACGYTGTDFKNIPIVEDPVTDFPREKGIYQYAGNIKALLFVDGNGNSLMLPAGGQMDDSAEGADSGFNNWFHYWTSTTSDPTRGKANIFYGDFNNYNAANLSILNRFYGCLIRPVKK